MYRALSGHALKGGGMRISGTSGDLPIVDCDVHPMINGMMPLLPYMSRSWRRHFESRPIRRAGRARDRYAHPDRTYRGDAVPESGIAGSDRAYLIEQHIDRFGISSVLLLSQQAASVTAWTNHDEAAAFVAATNRFFLSDWVERDDRFRLALTVSPHDMREAVREVEHCEHQAAVAVQLPPTNLMPGDRSYDPLYEVVSDKAMPVVLHQTGSEGCYVDCPQLAGGAPRFYAERHALVAQIGAAYLVDLIWSRTFERFPGLKIVFVEWGFSWLPALLARLDFEWSLNSRHETDWPTRQPSETVKDHVVFTTQPIDEPRNTRENRHIFTMDVIRESLLFSSDYPHYDTDNPDLIVSGRIPQDIREAVCFRNAVRIFGDNVLPSRVG